MFATLVSATLFAALATRGVFADEFSIATPTEFVQVNQNSSLVYLCYASILIFSRIIVPEGLFDLV